MKKLLIAFAGAAMLALPSCINEWPKAESRPCDVTLTLHSDTDWLPVYDMTYTREDGYEIQYQVRIYQKGNTSVPLKEITLYSSDFTRPDLNVDVTLDPGDYEVFVWSDVCSADTNQPLFYNSEDFAKITYLTPYVGDSNNKDAFRGQLSFTIENSMEMNPTAKEVVTLKRPLSRYIFVATDLEEFVQKEVTRGHLFGVGSRDEIYENADKLEEQLKNYRIRIYYPLYMPAVFDNFTNKPIDSWTGISFNGNFVILSNEEAQLGLDYVMMNVDASSVQVAMEIFDNEGVKISGTPTINIPTLRDRTTIVYGQFLTADEDAGVTIDPDFKGQFNIPYN